MKKLILILSILICTLTAAFALPGFTPYIKDTSGEFVYYRDYSFARESYIGILGYSDSEYQIRYIAPADSVLKLPKKEIALLIKVNPKSNHMEFTGETFLSEMSNNPEDIDIMNYLHDILYEFSARRIKVSSVSPMDKNYVLNKDYINNGITVSDEYVQFGGKVKITYDCLIPLFNLKCIKDSTGKILLECVTIGCLRSNDDKTFETFAPIDLSDLDKKLEPVMNKKPKAKLIKYEGTSVMLDSHWTQGTDNIYTFGDEAVSVLSTIKTEDTDFIKLSLTLARTLLWSSEGQYTNFRDISFSMNKSKKELNLLITHYGETATKEAIVLCGDKTNKKNIHYFGLIVKHHAFSTRNKYYENILNSFKVE